MSFSTRSFLVGAIAVAALPVGVVAQQPDSTRLQTVVVTATRHPTPIAATSQPVTVITGDDLRARGVQTAAEALREVSGAAVAQTGSTGGVTSLFLRGGESRYTKVLIDGVAVNTVGGTVFLQNLTVDNVDRIEVVEGPASALYGADAMAGVIQIFTRRGSDRGADLSVDGGTYGTRDASASVRAGSPLADVSLGGGWHHTDGLVAFNNGYTNGTLSAAAAIRPRAGTAVHLTSRYTGATYHFPTDFAGNVGDTNSYTREHRVVVGADLSQAIGSALTLRLLGGDMEVHGLSEDRHPGFAPGTAYGASRDRTDGARRTAELRAELSLQEATLITVGVPYERESEASVSEQRSVLLNGAPGASSATSNFGARTTRGAYVAAQSAPRSWIAYDASVRHDHHSDYQSITTYHAGVSVAPWTGGRIRAAYGTGFNAPAFYETIGSLYNEPNPNLQPEQTRSLDVGVEQQLFGGRADARAGAFDQRFSQIIQYTVLPTDVQGVPPAVYENLTGARAHGFSGGLRVALTSALTASADYTHTIARVTSVPPAYQGSERAGDQLLRRPSHSGSASLAYAEAGWNAAAVVTYVGSRPDLDFRQYPSPRVALPAYTTLDLSAAVPVIRSGAGRVALTGRVANALDRRYQEILNFPAARRTILVGARVTALP